MKHHIKCPNCQYEFEMSIDDPVAPHSMREIAITPCRKCGAPLVNFNNADVWKVLEPSDLDKVPDEIKEQIGMLLLDRVIGKLSKILDDATEESVEETPFTRTKFFLAGSEVNSEGCVVLMKDDPSEWRPFMKVCGDKNKVAANAMAEIATTPFNQNVEEN